VHEEELYPPDTMTAVGTRATASVAARPSEEHVES